MAEAINSSEAKVINLPNAVKKPLNTWMIASIVLSISIIILLVFPNLIGISGNAISEKDAGTKAIDYINKYLVQNSTATLSSIRDLGDMYEVNTSYNGKIIPVYITKDGKYLTQSATSMENPPATNKSLTTTAATPQPVNVTKSDKPTVKAFVFSYCPYGLQFEKALSPVYTLLKDKADISLVYIGAMHGDYERVESLRQICIQSNYGKDKLWEYLNQFNANTTIGACKGDAACLTPLLNSIMSSLSIDSSKIDACMASDATALYNADMAVARSAGTTSSPTFTINGAKVTVNRSPEAIKQAVCDAFITAPAECSQTLSNTKASAGFGAAAASSTSTAGCGA